MHIAELSRNYAGGKIYEKGYCAWMSGQWQNHFFRKAGRIHTAAVVSPGQYVVETGQDPRFKKRI